MKEQKN
jgi:hypothetical protein